MAYKMVDRVTTCGALFIVARMIIEGGDRFHIGSPCYHVERTIQTKEEMLYGRGRGFTERARYLWYKIFPRRFGVYIEV